MGAQGPVVSKWFFKVYSQCAFAPLEPHKIEILRLIIAMIPGYTREGSLTTFIRDQLLHFQEKNNLHPGKFYDYIYQMCGKFTKAKNQIARLQVELDLLIRHEAQTEELKRRRSVFTQQIVSEQARGSADTRDSIVCEASTVPDSAGSFDQADDGFLLRSDCDYDYDDPNDIFGALPFDV